jgi:hypothetical protein
MVDDDLGVFADPWIHIRPRIAAVYTLAVAADDPRGDTSKSQRSQASAMWRRQADTEVTCIACGETLDRADAREYDKHGDRWDRREKAFEHLCKPCYRELCHQPREGLEALLVEIGSEPATEQEFVERYYEAVERAVDGADGEDGKRGGER